MKPVMLLVTLLVSVVSYTLGILSVATPKPQVCVQEYWLDPSPETSWLDIGYDTYCATHQTVWHRDNPDAGDDISGSTGTGYFIWKLHYKMSSPPSNEEIDKCATE